MHGRIEIRSIWASDEPAKYDCTDFPHCKQAFLVERDVERKYRGIIVSRTLEYAYGLTSLTKANATPERLLSLNRGHWTIENKLHYVRDVTFGEDHSRVRTKNGPRMMASIRNLVISLIRLMGFRYIPEGNRIICFQKNRNDAFELLGL